MHWLNGDFKAPEHTVTLNSRPNSIDGYIPRNKKLLSYPFLYVGFNPLGGSSKLYRYEDFEGATPRFNFMSEVNPNPSILVLPQNYRGATGLDGGSITGYPSLAWITDYFNTWLAQNGNIVELQMGQEQYNYEINQVKQGVGMLGTLGSLAQGNVSSLGTITNQALDLAQNDVNHEYYIKNQLAQIEKQSMLPNSVNMGTTATALGYNKIEENVFTRYSIKYDQAQRLDKYFDMYGYLTNTVKYPNINNRKSWNYIKTIGCHIKGKIPQTDLAEIMNMHDTGITFWHNTNSFGNYLTSNT